MISRRWRWVGACSVGSSHLKANKGCEDFAACIEFPYRESSILAAVVSDGAGSAQHAAKGSMTIVCGFLSNFAAFLKGGGGFKDIDEDRIRDWLDNVRERIFYLANAAETMPREFAGTLVAALVGSERTYVCHIGDGACVLRKQDDVSWIVPSWPAHGEYASSTCFVTDDPQPQLQLTTIEGRVSDAAVFSDGIERLALDFINRQAHGPFFESMFRSVAGEQLGRDRRLSVALKQFLDSEKVSSRTDDDKSLVLARRVN